MLASFFWAPFLANMKRCEKSLNRQKQSDILYSNNMKKNVLLVFAVFLFLAGAGSAAHAKDDITPALERIGDNVIRIFQSLDNYLDASSNRIAEKSIDPFDQQAMSGKTFVSPSVATKVDPFTINPILSEVRSGAPYAFNAAFVSNDGVIRAVQPLFPGTLGANIGMQEQFIRVRDQKEPVLSKVFLAVEGFPAVAFQHPVLTSDGLFLGAVSLLIRPQTLLRSIIDNEMRSGPVDVWVMQPDGMIIYDKDDEEIGKNLFTDDLYKPFTGLVELGKKIATAERGASKYDFFAFGKDNVVTKNAAWITIDVYGTQWKIIAVTSTDKATSPDRTLRELGAETIGEALVTLSKNGSLLSAAAKGDDDQVKELFGKFHEEYPCYSIQWVDKDLVNRTGFPSEHTLFGYKFDAGNNPKDTGFINAVNSRKEIVFESSLIEGGTGKFHLVPLFKGNDYLGMVYYIWIKP